MSAMQRIATHEFKNDYLYIVLRQTPEHGPQSYILCCGINMTRFDPICWGKTGICSNPAFKGLQQLRADVSSFAITLGRQTRSAEQFPCSLITPPVGDGWYRETPLLIDQASPTEIKQILEYSVRDLVATILTVCAPDAKVPAKLPTSSAMQKFLNSLHVINYREAAPPPIAKRQNPE